MYAIGPVVCCLLLVVAGCQSAPSATDTTAEPTLDTTVDATTTEATDRIHTTDSPTTRIREVDVEGGTLPYDATTVWTRVESMLEVDVGAPLTVRLTDAPESQSEPTRFQRLLGVSPTRVGFAGATRAPGNEVVLNESALDSPHALEGTLAHEYVHVVQMRQRTLRAMARSFERPLAPDERAVLTAIREGTAVYGQQHYAEQYLANEPPGLQERYLNADTVAKQFLASYYFGSRYVNATVDSPPNLATVYENPPRTTEELVHSLEPGSEPVANLSVDVASKRQHQTTGRLGELFVRTTLGTGLNETAAARAADGWGNDTLVEIGSGNETEYAWILRWDDAANATEFQDGIDSYLTARSDLNASVRVDRVAPETTVLFVGSEPFVAEASATGTNELVTVRT